MFALWRIRSRLRHEEGLLSNVVKLANQKLGLCHWEMVRVPQIWVQKFHSCICSLGVNIEVSSGTLDLV